MAFPKIDNWSKKGLPQCSSVKFSESIVGINSIKAYIDCIFGIGAYIMWLFFFFGGGGLSVVGFWCYYLQTLKRLSCLMYAGFVQLIHYF